MTAPVVVPRSCSVIPLQPSTMSRSAAATAPNEYLSMVFMRPSLLFVGVVGEAVRRKVRLAAQLHDARGELIGVALLLVRMREEFGGDALRMDAFGHEVMPPVAQHAHDLGGERVIELPEHRFPIGAVSRSYR